MRPFVVFYVVDGRSHTMVVHASGVEDAKKAVTRKFYGRKVEVITVGRQTCI